jgi:5-methylcytosine-specific restriction endonuclease McrA
MSGNSQGLNSTKTLVLNADYIPIAIIPWYKAIGMVHVKKTATLVSCYEQSVVDSKGNLYELPAVVTLNQMITKHYKKVPFNRKNVMLRDKLTCCYCAVKFHHKDLTYDHVIPRSKWTKEDGKRLGHGTPTNWDNIVTCCRKCNTKKADRTPEQAGMKLLRKPRKPTRAEVSMSVCVWEHPPKEWTPYLTPINNLAST